MRKITPVDVSRYSFDIHRNLSVTTRAQKAGPPERIDGMRVLEKTQLIHITPGPNGDHRPL
jgi:hypothetical protein